MELEMRDLSRLMCASLSDHLKEGGRPVVPAGGDLLWKWFLDLSATRTWGRGRPDPICLGEIDAYRRLTSWPISERHVRVLLAMDDAFLRHFLPATGPGAISRPLTASLFDAIF